MKVLLVSHTYSAITHGPAKFARLLMELGHDSSEIDLRILTESPTEDSDVYPVEIKLPRPFHAAIKMVRSVRYHRAAMKIREEFPFDFLIYNDGITGFWSALRLQGSGTKVIVMVNDDEYLLIGQNRVLTWRKRLISNIHHYLERLAVHKATLCITCSDYLRSTVERVYQPKKKNVRTLYQGVHLPEEVEHNPVLPFEEPIKILFVKSNPEIGGLPILLAALGRLQQYRFHLSVVGPPRYLFEEYTALIPNDRVEVQFHGPIVQAKLFQLMQTYDILCTPSLFEGLGVANIEGLAHGITVVSSDVGGISEVLENGKLGWLATPGDADDLANTVEVVLNTDLQERRQKAQAGKKSVENRFTAEKMIGNLIQILQDA